MFTGIIETSGLIREIRDEQSNRHFIIESAITNELKIDQSVAHNGICLTVVELLEKAYRVTAIEETLNRTNLSSAKSGDKLNIERCMLAGSRFDGHIVQGHVDATVKCLSVTDLGGSWDFVFAIENDEHARLLVEKGSVCLNGVSLTVVKAGRDRFSVHLIPYTYEYTNLNAVSAGSLVNVEFDIIGKYIARQLANRKS